MGNQSFRSQNNERARDEEEQIRIIISDIKLYERMHSYLNKAHHIENEMFKKKGLDICFEDLQHTIDTANTHLNKEKIIEILHNFSNEFIAEYISNPNITNDEIASLIRPLKLELTLDGSITDRYMTHLKLISYIMLFNKKNVLDAIKKLDDKYKSYSECMDKLYKLYDKLNQTYYKKQKTH